MPQLPLHHPLAAFALLWAGLACAPAQALDRNRSIAQHALDSWTTTEGLPRNTVEAVTQTPDGLLWFATSDGLARLEGEHFRTWTHEHFPEVATLAITALEPGLAPGELWLGTEGSGLLHFDYHSGAYEVLREDDGLCNDNISALAMDHEGRLWIGTESVLACSLFEGELTPFPLPEIATHKVRDIAIDKKGGVYMAALTDALLHAAPRAKDLQVHDGLPGPASAVLVDKSEAVFVGTTGFGVYRFLWDTGEFVPIAPEVLGSASVRSLERDEQGVLWVGTTGHGVLRVRLDDEQVNLARDHIEATMVTDLLADEEGSLWVTTMGHGVRRLVDHRLYTISERHGLTHTGLLSLTEAWNGDLLIGTAGGGIFRLDGVEATPLFPPGSPLDNAKVVSMATGAGGVIYASLYEQGVARLGDGEITMLGTEQGLADLRTSAVFQDRAGGLWIGHYSGMLERIHDDGVQRFGPDQGMPGQAVLAITQHSDGTVWIGTRGGGAGRIVNGVFVPFELDDQLPSDNVNAIHETGAGTLWFCTSEGLARYHGEELLTIGREQGLPAGAVYDITMDRGGKLWLTTDKGIVEIHRTEIDALATAKVGELSAQLYDDTRGMLTAECSGAHQNAVLKSSGNAVFVATSHGLVVVEPMRQFEEPPPPRTTITGVSVGGSPTTLAALDAHPKVGRGRADITFSYLTTSNLQPRATRYRYRLVGLDAAWTETPTTTPARYPALPPGRYTFEVQASVDGDWAGPAAQQSFTVARQPWQWTWLWLSLALLGAVATATLHRRRVRNAAISQQELEAALDAKARELRDAALVDPLTGLRNRRFVMEVILPEVVAFLAQKVQIRQSGTQRRSTAETGVYGVFLFDVDFFKKINDTLGHEAGDRMLQQFSYLLRRSVRQDDFVVRWGGEEFLVVLRFSDHDHLDQYARRVREQVERTTFLVSEASGGALKKTASLGYVSLPFFDEEPNLLEFEQALLLADQALYYAKESGRNRAVRAVSTGKVPQPAELRQMVRSLDWAIDNGFARLETFASKDG